ncbi:MAG: response regulator [Desulfovibrio sp.]|nr:response regulator [Desulfovibrio sp.]
MGKRSIIAVVDDSPVILKAARVALMDEYDIITLPSGQKLFHLLNESPIRPNLILLDVLMPEQDGYEVIDLLKQNSATRDIPVIFLTAKTDVENELHGLSLGAVDYLGKPFAPPLLKKRVALHLQMERQKTELLNLNTNLHMLVEQKTADISDLQKAILRTVGDMVEFRDDITGSHTARTVKLLEVFIEAVQGCGLYDQEMESWDIPLLLQSSQLHDVGKIGIPDAILRKPGTLTADEFEIIKKHTVIGEKIIARLQEEIKNSFFLEQARTIAVSHHEKWDGTGYPHGIAGADIPLSGRLMAFVDVYDALVSERTYKSPIPHQEALGAIKELDGIQFEPRLTTIFVNAADRYRRQATDAGMELLP